MSDIGDWVPPWQLHADINFMKKAADRAPKVRHLGGVSAVCSTGPGMVAPLPHFLRLAASAPGSR